MVNGEMGEMRHRIDRTQLLKRTLGRTERVHHAAEDDEAECRRMTQGDEVATHCQMLIHRKRYYRHEHHHALHDRKRDQPLRHGNTDQVVSTDLALDECQGPEHDQRQNVGLYRSSEAWKRLGKGKMGDVSVELGGG